MSKILKRVRVLLVLFSCIAFVTACSEENDESLSVPSNVPAAERPKGPPNYGGAVDTITCDNISGWVWNAANPFEKIIVDVYVDGKIAESVPAANYRGDLRNLGGTSEYGFGLSTPAALKDGQPHSVGAKVSGSSYDISVWEKIQPSFVCKAK
jgi:hypothetical protein